MIARTPGRVALVSMPWASARRPSVAISTLKPCAGKAGFPVDVFPLNVEFAARLGLELYEGISNRAMAAGEWFFAQALFGPAGSGEIANSWGDMVSNPAAREVVQRLVEMAGGPDSVCNDVVARVFPFIEGALEGVDWSAYLAVGFTTTFAQASASLLLAKRLKERYPRVCTIFGGAAMEEEMGLEFLQAFPWVDCVAQGEAEETFPRILETIREAGRPLSLPGAVVRDPAGVAPGTCHRGVLADLNQAPEPDYSDYFEALDKTGLRPFVDLKLPFESSRGCWWGAKHHCSFCGLNGDSLAFLRKSADRVLAEILHLARAYRCLDLVAADNALAMEYFRDLLPALARQNLDLNLFYEVRPNLRRDQVRSLRAAGIQGIQAGIESLNTRLLQLMNKGTTSLRNIQFLKWCFEEDLPVGWNIIYGVPGETAEDYRDLPRLMDSISHLHPPVSMVPVSFERFSPYHRDAAKLGLTLRPDAAYAFVYPETRVRLERIAYYFERRFAAGEQEPSNYMAPSLAAWKRWRDL